MQSEGRSGWSADLTPTGLWFMHPGSTLLLKLKLYGLLFSSVKSAYILYIFFGPFSFGFQSIAFTLG